MGGTSSDDMNNTSSSETKVDKISLTSDSSSLEYSGFETMPYEDGSSDILGIVKFNFTIPQPAFTILKPIKIVLS